VQVAVECEGEHEGAVDASGLEDLQQLEQVPGLALLVTDVLAVQPDRHAGGLVVVDDLQAASAPVARAAVGGGAELGDRNRLALRDDRAHAWPDLLAELACRL
jgi:hypothetical protein